MHPRGSECENNRGADETRLILLQRGTWRASAIGTRIPAAVWSTWRSISRERTSVSTESIAPFLLDRKETFEDIADIGAARSRPTSSLFGIVEHQYCDLYSNGKIEKFSTLPNNHCVSAHPSRSFVLTNTRGQLLRGPHHPSSPGDSVSDSYPSGTAFARSVRPSHSTAARASIIRRTGIAASTRGAQIRADSTTPWRLAYPRRNGRRVRRSRGRRSYTGKRARGWTRRPHVLRGVRGAERRMNECASRSPASLAPLSGLRVEREKHRRTFEGSTATPTGVVAVTPACFSRQPACNVSPAAPTPPRRGRRASPARFSSPLLSHRPTRFPRCPLTPPLRRGERRHPSCSYAISTRVCVFYYCRDRANHGWIRGCLRYYYRDIRATEFTRGHDLKLQLQRIQLSS